MELRRLRGVSGLALGLIPVAEDEANAAFCWLALTLVFLPFGYTCGEASRVGLNTSRYVAEGTPGEVAPAAG